MKISIAMTTYNGEKYIEEQLESIYNQTCSCDELIICDDCSTDNTLEKITLFLKKNDIKNCKVISNQSNIGWKKNFRKALKECTGNIIFLSDQDDIWETNKIQEMRDVMESNDKILLLVSNYSIIRNCRTDLYRCSKEISLDNGTIRKIPFNERGLHIIRPGCVFCARKELVIIMLGNDNDKWAHDYILWCYAAIEDGLYLLNRKLIKYRRHDHSVTKRNSMILKTLWIDKINQMLFFREYCKRHKKTGHEQIITHIIYHIRKRMYCIYKKKMLQLILHQIKYFRYYYSVKNLLCDECRILFNKH